MRWPPHPVVTALVLSLTLWVGIITAGKAAWNYLAPLVPPREYAHLPKMPVLITSSDDPHICGTPPLGVRIVGCTLILADRCDVVIPLEAPDAVRRKVLNHELAHCNGWTHK